MTIIVSAVIIWVVAQLIREAKAKRNARRIAKEQARIAEEMREMRQKANEEASARIALEREQMRQRKEQEQQRKEQERLAKEQEKQEAQIAKHEEMIAKLEQKMSLLEDEMRFNEHQRGSVSKLLNIAEDERDCLIKGSKEWQKAHKKVIALENQYHTYDKRLKKAMSDYKLCKMQKSA